MSTEMETNIRPNIRIEIQNNTTESTMEVDEEPVKADSEEGEIHEQNDEEIEDLQENGGYTNKDWSKSRSVFTTGINIFDKHTKEKLQERAKRFALKPEEINAFTDEDLKVLYDSLGITPENENEVRFDAIHMIGIQGLIVEDILEYFAKYAPNKIEWITEDSCNVVWLENIPAARALHYNSKHVRGMPVRAPSDPFLKEFLDDIEEPEKETGQSILLKNREVQLKEDEVDIVKKPEPKNSVDISEITISVPPGYWRLGEKHPKSKCILLRFALKIDKQPYKSESFLKYYKKFGNSKNVISENKKKEIRSIFERNKDLISNDKNPWGSLARNWDHDAKFREREPVIPVEQRGIEVKNPKLLARLGVKRNIDEVDNDDVEENVIEKHTTVNNENRKTKMPRMRMYADEEEEKLKHRKALQKIKRAEEVAIPDESSKKDLRNVLSHVRRPIVVDHQIEEESELPDLGAKLKNRNKNMIFAVERTVIDNDIIDNEQVEADIRTMLALRHKERQRLHAVDRHERVSERNRLSEKSKELERYETRNNESVRKQRRHHSPVQTLHSDRISVASRKRLQARRRSRSREYESKHHSYDAKPKSKVAVVIKTQKKPTVASTVWSRVNRASESNESSSNSDDDSGSESEQSSSSSSSSSDDDSDSDSSTDQRKRPSVHVRPGFNNVKKRISHKIDHRSPLKITMPNDHFKK